MPLRTPADDGGAISLRVFASIMLLCAASGCSTSRGAEAASHLAASLPGVPAPVRASASPTPAAPVDVSASQTATRSRPFAPTELQVRRALARAVETGSPTTHFKPLGGRRTFPDGRGHWLTTVVGQRWPTGDGRGQVTFVWHDDTLVGIAERVEALGINEVAPAASGSFVVRYLHYAPHDPYCCPTEPLLDVTYRWDGTRLHASKAVPAGVDGWAHVALR